MQWLACIFNLRTDCVGVAAPRNSGEENFHGFWKREKGQASVEESTGETQSCRRASGLLQVSLCSRIGPSGQTKSNQRHDASYVHVAIDMKLQNSWVHMEGEETRDG